jgi:hypothetical protein
MLNGEEGGSNDLSLLKGQAQAPTLGTLHGLDNSGLNDPVTSAHAADGDRPADEQMPGYSSTSKVISSR